MQIALYAGSAIETQMATLVAAQARAAGIDVTLKQYSPELFLAREGPIMQGRFQVALYDYQSSYDPDASWLLACDQWGPRGFNDARYCNRAVDRALRRGVTSFDRSDRIRAYALVQRQLAADLPYDILCQVREADVIPDRLSGYEHPLLSPFHSAARWRLGRR
jgi:peptide/nickel transport system substrate-binding protein